MKRLAHYLILAAVLVGVPLACCVLAGKKDILDLVFTVAPKTEDWGSRPELLWNCRKPFAWWAFAAVLGVIAAWAVPFAIRFAKAARGGKGAFMAKRRFPWWGWLGVAVLLGGWTLAWTRFPWMPVACQRQTYLPLWIGLILIANALCFRRSGRSLLTHATGPFLWSFPASSIFWWFFEYLNRYVWNWYYVGIAGIGDFQYIVFATLSFATVLPGIASVAAWLGTYRCFAPEAYAGMWRVNVQSPLSIAVLALLSAYGLVGIVFIPEFAYPFLWISPLMVFVLVQVLLKERSVLDDLASGDWSLVFRFGIAALVCGLCWETWNYWSLAKWIYAVPYVHRFQIWEMPLLGFGGYLPFGMECAAVAAWLSPKLVRRR